MASMKQFTTYVEPEPLQPDINYINLEIFEYIYCASFYDIIADDGLINIIIKEGFYMAALCEAHGFQTLDLELSDGTVAHFEAPGAQVPLIHDLIYGNTKFGTPGLVLLNKTEKDSVDTEQAKLNIINQSISQGQY